MGVYKIENGVSICVEHNYLKPNVYQDILSYYDEDGSCLGDFDITNEDIYEVENPFFLSDIFVFQKKHFRHCIVGDIDTICFIKLNYANKIEEIGFDFSSRFHLERDKKYKKATPLHKIPFLLIGDEMWLNTRKEE